MKMGACRLQNAIDFDDDDEDGDDVNDENLVSIY
jgi:hypothetical protein